MKTIIKITKDIYTDNSYQMWKEDINYLVNELDVLCEVKNNNFNNVVEDEKNYQSDTKDYKNIIIVYAKGYSQSDWQEYVLHYNEASLDTPQQRTYFSSLVEQLEKSFTHFNDYSVEKYEQTEIDGKIFNSEGHDYTTFSVNYIEFPEDQDVLDEYNSIYGIDYDQAIVALD